MSPVQHKDEQASTADMLRRARREFTVRVVIVFACAALAFVIYRLFDLILLVFAAILVAIILHAMAEPIARRTGMRFGLSLTISSIGLCAILAGLFFAFGSEVIAQMKTVGERLPEAGNILRGWLRAHDIDPSFVTSAEQALVTQEAASFAGSLLTDLASAIAAGAFALVGGVYIAAQPGLYRSGVLALIPPAKRESFTATGSALALALRQWLVGQLVIMAAVGLLTGLGAWALGIPAPIALGIIAGLLEFVPYLGPILTIVPAILLGLTIDIETAVMALIWLIIVQQIEGYLITPLVQRKAVSLPPAISLFALVTAGLLFGVPGVLLALPLAVVAYVLVHTVLIPAIARMDTGCG